MASDYIVVFAIDEDPSRAAQLVGALGRRGFRVIPNETAGGSDIVFDFLYDAAAVLVACGEAASDEWSPIAAEFGRVVPVKFAPAAHLPDQFAQLDAIDLSGWPNGGPEFEELVRRLSALVDDSRQKSSHNAPSAVWGVVSLGAGATAMSSPLEAIGGLENLADSVRDVGVLLADDAEQTRQIRDTLNEIGTSYRVVQDAIETFYATGADPDRIDVAALAKIRSGRLAERIHNGRGHCKRIGARYFAYGGLQGALKGRVSAGTLTKADTTFRRLTHADLDMFDALDSVGSSLTLEAREIYPLVIAGQRQEAQRRFLHAHEVLAPLEDALQEALFRFQDLEQSLGYAEDSTPEGPRVEDRSVNIYGPVTNSVVANTIKDSHVVLQSAQLPSELKDDMDQLLEAVGAMSESLSAADAEAAVVELDQLTREVVSEEPKVGIIKKCLRSLEQFGRTVADVGLPVVELVGKIAAFF